MREGEEMCAEPLNRILILYQRQNEVAVKESSIQ
jgi:hypothetical protein